MEASERTHVLEHLKTSRTKLLDAVHGLRQEQWDYRPEEGRWSIADCVEHVLIVESRITRIIGKTLQGEPTPEKKAQAVEKEALLRGGGALNRTRRFNAPEQVLPKRTWPDSSQLLAEFENTRVRTLDFVSVVDGDLRSHFFPHLIFGDLDCYQWMMLIPVHCDRHLAQIEEIKADSGFPRAQATPA